MNRWLHRLFDFERPETYGQRLFFRLFEAFVVFYVVRFSWEWGIYIQQIDSVLLPLGVAQYVDVSFMFDHGVSLLNAAAVTLLCATALLGRSRYAYMAAMPLFHLQYVSRYCLGEISHGSNLIGMTLLVLGLGGVFFARPVLRRRFVLGATYFFLGLGYTSAALCKIVATGLHWPRGEHLWLWIAEREIDTLSKFGTFDLNWLQTLILDAPSIGTVVLTFGLLTELAGFLAWWPRWRPYVLLGLIGMHVGVHLSMNILFDVFIYELILLALPWPALFDRLAVSGSRPLKLLFRSLPE